MSETKIKEITKEDIKAPAIEPGGTAVILQRHERYNRDRLADNSGSLFEDDAAAAKERARTIIDEMLDKDPEGQLMFLFVSSDTQYNKKGYRSMETVQLAEEATIDAMEARGIDPSSRVINLSPEFKTDNFGDKAIRPISRLREPDIFDNPAYIDYLREKYGDAGDGSGTGISKEAWAAHEADQEKKEREKHGAEGVFDIVDRTCKSLAILNRYANLFHKSHPNKKLLVWTGTHYDTISPLVKDATGTDFTEYIGVDYGGGVIVNFPPDSQEAYLEVQNQQIAIDLGHTSLTGARG